MSNLQLILLIIGTTLAVVQIFFGLWALKVAGPGVKVTIPFFYGILSAICFIAVVLL